MRRRQDDPNEFDGRPFRAPTNGGLFAQGTPWWIRVALTGGFPILVAAFFMGMLAGWVPSPWTASLKLAEATAKRVELHEQTTQALLVRVSQGLRIICENQAQTVQQQRNCGNIQ